MENPTTLGPIMLPKPYKTAAMELTVANSVSVNFSPKIMRGIVHNAPIIPPVIKSKRRTGVEKSATIGINSIEKLANPAHATRRY